MIANKKEDSEILVEEINEVIENESMRMDELFKEIYGDERDSRVLKYKENIERNHKKNIELANKLIEEVSRKLKIKDSNVPEESETLKEEESESKEDMDKENEPGKKKVSQIAKKRKKHSKKNRRTARADTTTRRRSLRSLWRTGICSCNSPKWRRTSILRPSR